MAEVANFVDWLSNKKCPRCKKPKLLAGPFYDRRRVRCLNCSYKFTYKKGVFSDA